MDPGAVVVGLVVLFFVVLIGLAARKMLRGQLHAPEQAERLEAGQTPEDQALEKEALGEPVPEPPPAPMKQGLEKTRKGFMARINELLRGSKLDASLVDELEQVLI